MLWYVIQIDKNVLAHVFCSIKYAASDLFLFYLCYIIEQLFFSC